MKKTIAAKKSSLKKPIANQRPLKKGLTSSSKKKVESTVPVMEVDTAGNKYWILNRKLHRIDGPAIEFISGTKRWYLQDISYTEAEWKKKVAAMKKKAASTSASTPKVDATQPVMYDPKFLNGKLHREDEPAVAQSTSVSDHLKSDLSQGTFRVAAKTIPKTARTALLAFLKAKKVKKSWLISAEEMMSTEWGLAFIQQVLAWSFRSLPQLKEDPRATALADEWAIDSIAVIGNEVISEAMTFINPILTQVLTVETPVRIAARQLESQQVEDLRDHVEDNHFAREATV
jgi:hypothetical protein